MNSYPSYAWPFANHVMHRASTGNQKDDTSATQVGGVHTCRAWLMTSAKAGPSANMWGACQHDMHCTLYMYTHSEKLGARRITTPATLQT